MGAIRWGLSSGWPERSSSAWRILWRGGLPPLGREAAPAFSLPYASINFYDCFAAEREQAPSPQVIRARYLGFFRPWLANGHPDSHAP
ncbi:hypothetical protein CS078_12250 [Pseudomonas prosekii]|uniref:Uncharacterized protein n=1 Tax=Pseudomonas prosekii TaxID=1148509 RepID=A0A3L8CN76_9PSED|nr:hypothetical protein CS078_12250 [Pseudomonas prosekii]RLU14218.1 hypothetical protein CS076_03475 [Pseudomonas prosekii]